MTTFEDASREATIVPVTRHSSGNFWRAVGRQFRQPTGFVGAWLGRFMCVLNAMPNRLALEALQLRRSDAVLELGFGPGRGLQRLARGTDGLVCGIDHSPEMIRQAYSRNRAAIGAGRIEILSGHFRALPWDDAFFHKILAVNVVYFFDPEGQAISEVHRVLKPGGRLAVYATERSSLERWKFDGQSNDINFDEAGLAAFLHAGGFASSDISISRRRLPLGIMGLVAVATKA